VRTLLKQPIWTRLTDFQVGKTGNKDGICDAGETCLSGYHSDMMEDSQGRQYLVYAADIETPCQRQITTSLLSAGPKLLISVAQGGGRTDVTPLHLCGGGPIELWAENHTDCARRAPFCVVRQTTRCRAIQPISPRLSIEPRIYPRSW